MAIFSRNDDGKKDGKQTRALPLLPLRDIIVFPHMVVPLFVGREKSIAALEEAMGDDKEILLCRPEEGQDQRAHPDDIFAVGTLGTIIQLLRLPDGTVKVLVEGKQPRPRQAVPGERAVLRGRGRGDRGAESTGRWSSRR